MQQYGKGSQTGNSTSKITAGIEEKKDMPANEIIYNAVLNVFGVFADGAPIKLNMEIKVLTKTNATWLVFIASPQAKANEVWKELYTIQKGFVIP